MNTFMRWVKFSFVGLIGIGVQLCVLFFLTRVVSLNYLVATVLAVESAVVHNFAWHQRFTWRDRGRTHILQTAARLFKFNAGNGAISLVGNVIMMRLLVGQLHLAIMPANLVSIAACALANFIVSDRWVFVATGEGAESGAVLTGLNHSAASTRHYRAGLSCAAPSGLDRGAPHEERLR